ncbi:ABC transporter substrate-binding protein [Devosia sp. YIM 151766]|uniref:ABC transporter substrate-binding protein n=1 Tax=Devosia sp. YIM 151766 TaxID=3017325 RepID=UPI00255CF27D|nr:ABC transporter substrate-binding protein [Devosia sp. YIM 151766]WIY52286.1 ABC transporter substrate-binding protein [Devosia sp. YIM 151766]
MKPISLFAIAALALASSPALAETPSIESCETVSGFEAVPSRVITLNQQATEIMLALGLESHLVGTAYIDDAIPERWQAAYDSVPVLSERYPAREVVLAENPDLLFAGFNSAFGEKALGAQEDWNDLGIGTYLVNVECRNLHPADVKLTTEPLFIDLERIGALFGVEDRAETVATDIRSRLAAIAGANPGQGRRAFLYDSGTETAFSAGCCGAPGLLLDAVGLENIAAEVEGRWADLAWEAVVVGDPDVIVLIEAEWSTAEDKIAHLKADPVLSELDAVREERFVTIPFSATVLGIRFVEGVEQLGADLAALD